MKRKELEKKLRKAGCYLKREGSSQSINQEKIENQISSRNSNTTLSRPSNLVQNYILCRNCSYHNPTTGKFCTKCGNKLV